jgi:hypothetical protein
MIGRISSRDPRHFRMFGWPDRGRKVLGGWPGVGFSVDGQPTVAWRIGGRF